MANSCSFCDTELVTLNIAGSQVRICPQCHSTFLTGPAFSNVKSTLSQIARKQWADILTEDAKSFQAKTNPLCIEHKQPLVLGRMPDVGIDGPTPTCCIILHLIPADFAMLLNRSLTIPRHTVKELKNKHLGMFARFVDSAMKAVGMGDKIIDDGLDDILWESKILPVLRRK